MLLSVENLKVSFYLRDSLVRAVRSVSFELDRGETVGIVGESGCGKTVLAHSLLRLIRQPPGRIEGRAFFDGVELISCGVDKLRSIRGNGIGMVFQDPSSAFNPYMRLSDQLIEPLLVHRPVSRAEALEAAIELLGKTGVPHPAERIRSYPHEFSGGMLQRAMIAMALMTRPKLLIADEPTTALDVTVQAQILQLLKDLRDEYNMSIIFITHNFGIVSGLCDRVLVMYGGIVVESAPVEKIFSTTAHPYTLALIRSVPRLRDSTASLHSIPGSPPDASSDFFGCPFYQRCNMRIERCAQEPVMLTEIEKGRSTACLRVVRGEIA